MPKYNSFASFAKQQLTNLNNALSADRVLREAVIVTVPEMKRRIQNQGQKSDGGSMESRSIRKFGAYSVRWGETRNAKGRQTSIIDLTFTGDMMNSLKPMPMGQNSFGIGFLSFTEWQKAAKNERLFGVIFDLSKYELQVSLATINKRAQQILSR